LAAGPNAVLCDAGLATRLSLWKRRAFARSRRSCVLGFGRCPCGVKTAASVLDGHESNGKQILPATTAAIEAVDIVWSWLQQVNMTQGKKKPLAACFKECMQAGSETMGFYRDGMVYFKEDIATAVNKYCCKRLWKRWSTTSPERRICRGTSRISDPSDCRDQGIRVWRR